MPEVREGKEDRQNRAIREEVTEKVGLKLSPGRVRFGETGSTYDKVTVWPRVFVDDSRGHPDDMEVLGALGL